MTMRRTSNKDNTSLKVQKLRNAEYYDTQEISDRLYRESSEGKMFHHLMEHIITDNNLLLAYRNIKNNKGSNTPGVDKRTIKEINKMSEQEYLTVLRKKFSNFHPKAVRRIEIPKPDGRTRPLGIPTIWDRLIQQSILQVLEPICEAKFYNHSYGFRPNRSVEHAIAHCYRFMQMQHLHYVVDIDIKGFFDNVSHSKLLKQMWSLGIRDKNLITIIGKMLKAPVEFSDGTRIDSEKGTPQGGILSPLLSNIVLNEFDWWIASQWEQMKVKTKTAMPVDRTKEGKGIDKGNQYKELRKSKLKEMFIVRYADDFKIFCRNKSDAVKIFHACKNWLLKRLHLEISDEKSKIVNLKSEYSEFLGLKMKVIPKGDRWIVKSHMSDKAFYRTESNLREIIKQIKYPKGTNDEVRKIGLYNSTVVGVHQYFRIATMISFDLGLMSYRMQGMFKSHKLAKRIKREGHIASPFIKKEYGQSKQIRFIRKQPLLPIGYIKHKNPMMKKTKINKYTVEGRRLIHSQLSFENVFMLRYIMENPVKERTMEYNDNRLSLYSAQKGKCKISQEMLTPVNIRCHHIEPRFKGHNDSYDNLILVTEQVHKLIHATDSKTIENLMQELQLKQNSMDKLNKYRKLAGNTEL